MADRTSAEAFPPGEYIRDELEARGWTQADLAFIIDRPLQAINEIIAGKKAITPETACGLGEAFGTSAEFWMNLEAAYRLAQAKNGGGEGEVSHRAKLCSFAPVKEMTRRGWIAPAPDAAALEGELIRFFQVKSLEDDPDIRFAARMGTPYAELSPAHKAWFCRAQQLARMVHAATFQQRALEQGMAELRQMIASEHDVRRIPALLADIGIRLVLLEHLAKTQIDGAALWLDENSPVIALSLRYDRIDYFWFTLCHELSHIKHHDGWSIDDALVGSEATPTADKPEFEQRADYEAADFLVPSRELDKFILRVRPLYSKKKLVQFANRIQVHPGIIVGQLQRRKEIGYGHSREMLIKIRAAIIGAALSDGWGDVPPVK